MHRALVPIHPDLRLAGLLPPLDAPHHMRASEWRPYREGVVLRSSAAGGSFIEVGLPGEVKEIACAR
jgi:methyltransferase